MKKQFYESIKMNSSSQFEATGSSSTSAECKQGIKRKMVHKNINLNLNAITDTQCTSSDHTPTPTRFIRNCEELGLFQDLQNVNPFEEGFREALSNPTVNNKLCPPLSATDSNNDGTLHTPKILPLIYNAYSLPETTEEPSKLNKSFSDDDADPDFNLKISPDEDESHNSENLASESIDITTDKDVEEVQDANKTQQNSVSIKLPRSSTERRRETNRNAARRAYKRRLEISQEKEKEREMLIQDNAQLRQENALLSIEVKNLRRQLRTISTKIILGQHISAQCEKSIEESTMIEESVVSEVPASTAATPHTKKHRILLPKLPIFFK